MPTAPPTRCHCGARATSQGRCEQHQPTRPAGWAKRPSANNTTLTPAQRRAIHDRQIATEPQCRNCGTTTNLEADHIIEIADGGAPTHPDNLQTLCHDCHDKKTRTQQRLRRWARKQQGGGAFE